MPRRSSCSQEPRPSVGCIGGTQPPGEPLAEAVRTATLPAGRGQAWLAGESACVRDLRRHLLDDRRLERRAVYATGYWRAR